LEVGYSLQYSTEVAAEAAGRRRQAAARSARRRPCLFAMVFGGARDSETGGVFLEPKVFYQNSPLLSSLVVKGKKGIANLFFLTLLELDEILVGDCDTDVWGWGKKEKIAQLHCA
jgi:hypothetical protein